MFFSGGKIIMGMMYVRDHDPQSIPYVYGVDDLVHHTGVSYDLIKVVLKYLSP